MSNGAIIDRAIDIVNGLHHERLDYDNEYVPLIDALQLLSELQEKIKSGLLVECPCKVGDMVYEVINDKYSSTLPFIQETIIEKIVITKKGLRLKLARNSFYETAVSKLGKTIFTTKEAAEAKLNELKGE